MGRFKEFFLIKEAEIPSYNPQDYTGSFTGTFERATKEDIIRGLKVGIEMALENVQTILALVPEELSRSARKCIYLVRRCLRNIKSVTIADLRNTFIFNSNFINYAYRAVVGAAISAQYLIKVYNTLNWNNYGISDAVWSATSAYSTVENARNAIEENNSNIELPYTAQQIQNAIVEEIMHDPIIPIDENLPESIGSICDKENLEYEDIEYLLIYGQDILRIDFLRENNDKTFTLLLRRLNINYPEITGSIEEIINVIWRNAGLRERLRRVVCRRN